jgi:hypothetical protein
MEYSSSDVAYHLKSSIFIEVDNLLTTVNKDYHLKESMSVKNLTRLLTGRTMQTGIFKKILLITPTSLQPW